MSDVKLDQARSVRGVGKRVSARGIAGVLGTAVAAMSVLLSPATAIPFASADPPPAPAPSPPAPAPACPDVEVVFARGTFEPPGIGATGQAFVDALRPQLGGKSLDVYPVNYPASLDFQTAADGVIDASNKVRDMASRCPATKTVVGGYSQGAAVAAYITADAIPAGFTPPAGITGPMPPEVANHVAAVALFGKPSSGFLNSIARDAPPITIGHLYSAKTVDLCIPEDPVCSAQGGDNGAHVMYAVNGMAGQAADFVARHVSAPSAPGMLAPGSQANALANAAAPR